MNGYTFGPTSNENREGVNPKLIAISDLALFLSPTDFWITSGVRTAEEQNELFKKGASRCDGYKKLSNHQGGNALDLMGWIDGKSNEKRKTLTIVGTSFLIAARMLGHELTWGGQWKRYVDMYHVELK